MHSDQEYKQYLKDKLGGDVPVNLKLDQFNHRNQADAYIEIPKTEYKRYGQQNVTKWLYRGDTRDPDDMFESGFTPRLHCRLPIWRCGKSDVHPHTTVCLSKTVQSAALFPLVAPGKPLQDTTWIYFISLTKDDEIFDTQDMQARAATGALLVGGGAGALARNLVSAGEIGKQYVPPRCIVAAIKINREWQSTDWTQLGRYRVVNTWLSSVKFHDGATDAQKKQQIVIQFFRQHKRQNFAWVPMSLTGRQDVATQLMQRYTQQVRASVRQVVQSDVSAVLNNMFRLPGDEDD